MEIDFLEIILHIFEKFGHLEGRHIECQLSPWSLKQSHRFLAHLLTSMSFAIVNITRVYHIIAYKLIAFNSTLNISIYLSY